MEKLYNRIDFQNDTVPALNETNMNAMSKAIDDIDDRLIKVANASGSGGGGGATKLRDLEDVNIQNGKTNDILSYQVDAGLGYWTNKENTPEAMNAEVNIPGHAYYDGTLQTCLDGMCEHIGKLEDASGSTSYYGTSAEFEEFKKRTDIPDGTEYNVTDDYSEGGSSEEIYSTDEVLIGKFLGKNLYRKVCRTTEAVTSTNKEYTQTNLTDVKWIVNCHVFVEHSDNSWFIPFQAKIQNNHIYGKGISGDTPDSGYYTDFILEYTKVGD